MTLRILYINAFIFNSTNQLNCFLFTFYTVTRLTKKAF